MSQDKLKIYYTTDIHGYFFPTDYISTQELASGLFKCAGQFVKDGNTLIIDGGDILQGSALTQYCRRVDDNFQFIAAVMDRCGYDVVTLGNHDFNYGQRTLRTYLDNLDAVCVCQNITDTNGNVIFPYVIKEMENGMRVGIVGLVTDFVRIWEKPENLEAIVIGDPFGAAAEALAKLKGQVDLTVGVYHGGFERDLDTDRLLVTSSEHIACKLCTELDFELLLTGHQHQTIPGRYYAGTYVIQPPINGQGYAYLEIDKQNDHLQIHSEIRGACAPPELAQLNLTSPELTKPDVTAWELTQPELTRPILPLPEEWLALEEKIQAWLEEAVGRINAPMPIGARVEMAVNGSALADLFNRVLLQNTGAQLAAVSLANAGAGLPTTVRRRDLLAAYPYPNTFVVLEITGAILRAALERSAEYLEYNQNNELVVAPSFLRPKIEHYNYDFLAGAETVIDYHSAVGDRVKSLKYDGYTVADSDVFTIALSNYRASGVGDYEMYAGCPVQKYLNVEMIDMLMEYFEGPDRL